MDAEFGPSMIYITNLDKPGFIGTFSSTLGEAGINIATFHRRSRGPGGNAVALIEIDGDLPPEVLAKVRALPQVQSARPLKFTEREEISLRQPRPRSRREGAVGWPNVNPNSPRSMSTGVTSAQGSLPCDVHLLICLPRVC